MTVQKFGAAHGQERDVETIELELEPEELRVLTQTVGCTTVGANDSHDGSSRGDHRRPSASSDSRARVALVLCTSAAVALLAVGDASVVRVPAVAPVASVARTPIERRIVAVKPPPPPVRFANPFDATEVFEFPAGTSKSAAREAVAKLLTERARGRRYLLRAKRAHRHRPHPVHAQDAMPPESSSAV